MHVVVVEDEILMHSILGRILHPWSRGKPAMFFSDGMSALKHLRKEKAGLLLADLNLPGISGEALLSQLSGEGRLDETPVIVMTGKSLTSEEAQSLHQIGRVRVVYKPYTVDSFRGAIRSLLGDPHG